MLFRLSFLAALFLLAGSALRAQFAPAQYIRRDTLSNYNPNFYEDNPWYVLDWDSDGFRDILFTGVHQNPERYNIYYLKNDGAGQYEDARLVFENSGLGIPGDINGDGNNDMVMYGPPGCDCIVWRPRLNNGQLGAAVPISDINFGVVTDIQKVVDWDGDGDLDVVMVDRWIENAGLGLFNDFHLFSGAITYWGDAIADLNGDGRQDVMSIPIGQGDPTPLEWIRQLPDGSFTTKINVGTLPAQVEQFFLSDLDADTDADLLIFSRTPGGHICSWYENDGTGNFGPNTELPTSGNWIIEFDPKPKPTDVTGDALPEIMFNAFDTVQMTRHLAWFQNLGNGQFAFQTSLNETTYSSSLRIADITGDAKNDIVVNNGAFLIRENIGNNTFSASKSLYGHDAGAGGTPIDVDNDGDLDLCFISPLTQNFGWRPNDGAGNFGKPRIVSRVQDNYYQLVRSTSYHPDVNGDSLVDLLVHADKRTFVWLGTGNGQFAAPDTFPMFFEQAPYPFLGDADGDGDSDVVFAYPATDEISWYPPDTVIWYANDGNGAFGPAVTNMLPDLSAANNCYGDLDGNGTIDLLVHILDNVGFFWYSGSYYWRPGLGNGVYGPKQLIGKYTELPAIYVHLCARDMDGDGDLDVFSENGSWYKNNGSAQNWQPVGTGLGIGSDMPSEDFDNDSDIDIFNGYAPALALYLNDGEGRFLGDPVWSTPPIPGYNGINTTVDLDNDEDLDIIFYAQNAIGWWENVSDLPPVSVKSFLDINSNGQQDSTENPLPGTAFRLDPGGLVAFANDYGIARFYVDTGLYQVTYLPGDCRVLTTDSITYTVQTPLPGPLKQFGFESDSTQVSISPYIAAQTPTRCGFEVPFLVSLRNTGCIAQRASFSLRLGPLVSISNFSPSPNFIQGDSLVWHTTDTLLPGEIRPIQLLLRMPGPEYLGQSFQINGHAWPTDSPEKEEHTTFSSIVNCAYDPNDKSVTPERVAPDYDPALAGLAYTIRFQNTGTDTAFNVIVRDTLDQQLDWSTFRVIAASHPYQLDLSLINGAIAFRFNNIMLLDSNINEPESHGFIQFAIQMKAGLPEGAVIENQAAIYFDFNPPILTNVAKTNIQALSYTQTPVLSWTINLSPNPNTGAFTLELPDAATAKHRLRIVNLTGQTVYEVAAQAGQAQQTMMAKQLPDGLYCLQVLTEGKVLAVARFVKQ